MHIALVGPAGVGKSTVGRMLADELHVPFVDLDDAIVRQTNSSVPALFAERGESGFRIVEREALLNLQNHREHETLVLATGGGVVTTEECRQWLASEWMTVYLSADVDTLVSHLSDASDERPLLHTGGSVRAKIDQLLQSRMEFYRAVAQMEVSVVGRSPAEVVEVLLRWVNESSLA